MSETDSNLVDEIVERQISCLYVVYAFAAALIVYLAWRSTYVRDYNQLDLYRRRTLYILNPQTGVFERHPIVLQSQSQSTNSATTAASSGTAAESDADSQLNGADIDSSNIVRLPAPPPTLESILDEVSGFTSGVHYNNPTDLLETDVNEEEAQAIIREMDSGVHTQEGLRQRRLAFFRNISGSNWTTAPSSATSSPATGPSTSTNATVPTVPSSSEPTAARPVADNQTADATIALEVKNGGEAAPTAVSSTDSIDNASSPPDNDPEQIFGDELTIKLKYLNDDLKIVKGRPSELIGDFKKRNFSVELGAHKLVRLVFNGHVLQPDSKTLTACGLFDNCVVHCLIHNPRPGTASSQSHPTDNPPVQSINDDGTDQIGIENLINANRNRNRNTQRLLHLSLFLICLSVIISWFFRIQYFQLFTWYSTVGLVLLTTFFLVIIPLIFLIEREIFRNL